MRSVKIWFMYWVAPWLGWGNRFGWALKWHARSVFVRETHEAWSLGQVGYNNYVVRCHTRGCDWKESNLSGESSDDAIEEHEAIRLSFFQSFLQSQRNFRRWYLNSPMRRNLLDEHSPLEYEIARNDSAC